MIIPIGWNCASCGAPVEVLEPNATGNLYLWPDPLKTKALCKNAQLCNERARAA